MDKTPTIRDLAAKSGYSRTTVSLALRNSPLIREDTREKIQKLASECGYRPDTLVSTLMDQLRIKRSSRGSEKIAYLTEWDTRDGWRKHSGHRNYYLGASARAVELGYEIEEIWARSPGLTGKRLSKILHTRAIRGVLISPLLRPLGHVYLDWKIFACAVISFTAIKPDLHRASHSHYQGMALALRHLKHQGYRRIGFAALNDQVKRVNYQWLASYQIFQNSVASADRIPPFLNHEWDKSNFKTWVDNHRPDVIVSNMVQPLNLLRELGYRVPEDIGYASIDRLEADDPWAGVDQRPTDVGAAAIDLIVSQLRNNEFGIPDCAKTVLIDGLWRDGASIRSSPLRARETLRKA
jgi:DNA-binding LacI/PurR family transcriptional regulator